MNAPPPIPSEKGMLWHEPGCFGLYLRDAIAFPEPLVYPGSLGLFHVKCDYVHEQIQAARATR